MAARRTNKKYTDEFKRDAVKLVLSTGRTAVEVAGELGISDTSLGYWLKNPRYNDTLLSEGVDGKVSGEEAAEAARLRRRIRELEDEIEILKRFTKYWVREGGK